MVLASLPLRERGLKPMVPGSAGEVWWSLPLRERGLKHNVYPNRHADRHVAPPAGAWIETVRAGR